MNSANEEMDPAVKRYHITDFTLTGGQYLPRFKLTPETIPEETAQLFVVGGTILGFQFSRVCLAELSYMHKGSGFGVDYRLRPPYNLNDSGREGW